MVQDAQALGELYLFLAKCFNHPSDELFAALTDSRSREDLWRLIRLAPFPLRFDGEFIPLAPSLSRDDWESEYINCFDLGIGGLPPCPLYESSHRDDQDQTEIHEDLIRFYEHFDIKPSDTNRDYPDHLVTELEFIALLLIREADVLERGKDPGPYRAAQLDFLERHLCQWVHRFAERARAKARERLYHAAGVFLGVLVNSHAAYLRDTLGTMAARRTAEDRGDGRSEIGVDP